MIVAFLRAVPMTPLIDSVIHWLNAADWVIPRTTVQVPAFFTPGSFLVIGLPCAETCWYSMTSCSMLRPLTSARYSTITPSICSPKLCDVRASPGWRLMSLSFWGELRAVYGKGGGAGVRLLLQLTAAAGELRQPE